MNEVPRYMLKPRKILTEYEPRTPVMVIIGEVYKALLNFLKERTNNFEKPLTDQELEQLIEDYPRYIKERNVQTIDHLDRLVRFSNSLGFYTDTPAGKVCLVLLQEVE